MAAKKLSILTELTLNAVGFNKGIDGAKEKFNALKEGTEKAHSSIKGVFSNMGEIFTPMTSQLGGLSSGIMSGVNSFKAMAPAITSVKAAFIATGIGAIVIGLATAFAGLVAWMKRTDEGGDTMRKVFDVVKAVISTILDKLAKLGSAIVKLFKGDFKGAAEDAKAAFTGWGGAISDNIEKAKKLNETQDKLEDYNETAALKRAKIQERITEFELKARDEEAYNAKQRMGFVEQLRQAYADLYKLNSEGHNLQLNELKQEMSTNANNQEIRQKINEKEAEGIALRAEYNNHLIATDKLYDKTRKALSEQIQFEKELSKVNNSKKDFLNQGMATVAPIAPKKLESKGYDNGLISSLTGRQLEYYKKSVFDFQAYNTMLGNSFWSLATNITNAFAQLGPALSQGANSFKEYASNLKGSVKNIIGSLIGESVAHAIASQIKFWAKLGPAGLVAAPIAAGMAAGLVKTAFNSLIPAFENGGIVPGFSYTGDKIPIMANSGEMVLNNGQQSNLFKMLNNGLGNGSGGEVVFRIEGNTLVGVLNNYNRQQNRFR